MRLKNKTVLVFGGSGGIGGALCRGFVSEGAIVVPTSRSKEKVEKMVLELKELGNQFEKVILTNTCENTEVSLAVKKTYDLFGKIDIMIYTSGAYIKKKAEDISSSDWDNVMNTNIKGAFFANQAVGKIMIKQGHGSIINIGSLGSRAALSNTLPYCVSKAGIEMLSKCLSTEWISKGVRVNCILPGVFLTDLNREALSDKTRLENIIKRTPAKRLGDLEELVGASVFLASDESKFVSGISLPVDGGFLASSGF